MKAIKNTKTITRIYAVLNKDWTYNAIGGEHTFEKGHRFDTGRKGNGVYINLQGELILPHWYGYGSSEVLTPDMIDIFEETETVTTIAKITATRVKVEGGRYVAVKKTAKKG